MNIHHRVFKILEKKQSVTDGRTDGQLENSIPHHKQSLLGGIKRELGKILLIQIRQNSDLSSTLSDKVTEKV